MLFGSGEFYRARTVVLATGVVVDATIEGEEDLVGQGVSYCVTCDGRLFAGRQVAYISYGPPGEEEAAELADAFGVGVTYLPQYAGEYRLPAGVHVRAGEKPERLARADDGVHVALQARDGDSPGGAAEGGELVADAVFFYREAVAPHMLLDGLTADGPHLVVDLPCARRSPACSPPATAPAGRTRSPRPSARARSRRSPPCACCASAPTPLRRRPIRHVTPGRAVDVTPRRGVCRFEPQSLRGQPRMAASKVLSKAPSKAPTPRRQAPCRSGVWRLDASAEEGTAT